MSKITCRYGLSCKGNGSWCKYQHKLVNNLCRFGRNCCNSVCPYDHGHYNNLCIENTKCANPLTCGGRHSFMPKLCINQNFSKCGIGDICLYGKNCPFKEKCKYSLHYSLDELFELGYCFDPAGMKCEGFPKCKFLHVEELYHLRHD